MNSHTSAQEVGVPRAIPAEPLEALQLARDGLQTASASEDLRSTRAFQQLHMLAESVHNITSSLATVAVSLSELNLRGEFLSRRTTEVDAPTQLWWRQAAAEVAALHHAMVAAEQRAARYRTLISRLAEADELN